MKQTPTGYCLNPHCGAPVPDGVLYCDPDCGKASRYRAYYKPKQLEANQRYRAKDHPKQKGKAMNNTKFLRPDNPLASRPATGPRCKTCGLVLYHYDIKRGECFTHAQERHIQLWNQPVRMTQAAASD
jgi:hypothetical protein